jgi:hypothetical protein
VLPTRREAPASSAVYYTFIQPFFLSAQHDMAIVPGMGHGYDAMCNSAQGKTVIFQDW